MKSSSSRGLAAPRSGFSRHARLYLCCLTIMRRGPLCALPVALVLAVGLCSTWGYAQPCAGDAFEPLKFKEYQIRAEQGDAMAQAMLGRCYATGEGAERNLSEAVKWFYMSADQGDVRGQCGLGNCYATGLGVKIDKAEAVMWYRKAAEQGYAAAQSSLGTCFAKGDGVEKDLAAAVWWYRKAAAQDDAWAQFNLGGCYARGEGVERNRTQAVKWLRKAAEQGLARAQLTLANCYYHGEVIAKDTAAAAKWFGRAAEQGDVGSQYNLGVFFYQGVGVKQDFVAAVKWFHSAAEQGDAGSQYNLGVCYRDGQGVPKDETEAVRWFRKAAEQEHSTAQYSLGLSYQKGIGVAQDSGEAVAWYRKAAAQGFAEAQYSLGLRYSDGMGVEKNVAEAVKWYRKAAKQGLVCAQRNLDASLAGSKKKAGSATNAALTGHLGASFECVRWEPVIFDHLGLIYDNRPEPLQVEIENLTQQAVAEPRDAACRYRLGCLLKFAGRNDEGVLRLKEAEEIHRKRLEADPEDVQGLTGLVLHLRGTAEGARMARLATEVAPQAWESWVAMAQHQAQALMLKCFEGVGTIDMSRLPHALQFQAQSEEQSKTIFALARDALASSLKAIEVAPADPEPILRHLALRPKVMFFVNSLHRLRREIAVDQAEVDRQSLELMKQAVSLCRDRPEALGAVTLLQFKTMYSLLPKNGQGRPDPEVLAKRQNEVLSPGLTRLRELCDNSDANLAAPACEAYGAVVFFVRVLGGSPLFSADVPALLARAVRLAPRRCLAWDLRITYAGMSPDGRITADSSEACTLAVERSKVLKTGRSQALVGFVSQKKELSKAAWERALKLEPENLEYLLNLAAISLRISHTAQTRAAAIGLLQKAADIWYANSKWQLRPELNAFRLRIFAVQQALGGDREGARATVEKILEDYPGDAQALSLQSLVAVDAAVVPALPRPARQTGPMRPRIGGSVPGQE